MSEQLKIGVKQLNNASAEWGDGEFCSVTSWHNEQGADISFLNIPPMSLDSTQLYALLAVLNNYIMANNIAPTGLSMMPVPTPVSPPKPPAPEELKKEVEPLPVNIEPTTKVETKDTFSGIIPNENILKKNKTIKITSLEKLLNEIIGFGEYLDKECEALYPIVHEHEARRGSDEGSQRVQAELERRLDLINFVRSLYKENIESKLIYEDIN